jgi:hypothetical protein
MDSQVVMWVRITVKCVTCVDRIVQCMDGQVCVCVCKAGPCGRCIRNLCVWRCVNIWACVDACMGFVL